MDLRKTGLEATDWNDVARERGKWQVLHFGGGDALIEGKSYSDVGDFRCGRKIAKIDCTCKLRLVCLSVRPSVSMEHLGSHWTDFMKFVCVFRKYIQKFKFH